MLGSGLRVLIMQRHANPSSIARSTGDQRRLIHLNWALLGALALWLVLAEVRSNFGTIPIKR